MMNPSILEEAKALEESLGVFGKRITSLDSAAVSTITETLLPVRNSSSSVITWETNDEDEFFEENNTSQFLKNEIYNNIYTSCLARVAEMSRNRKITASGNSEEALQEAKEWAAVEKQAIRDVEKSQQILETAQKEKELAEKRSNSTSAILHGKKYADKAYENYQIKVLVEKLAKAKVTTAKATLMAIEVRDTAQSATAEADLAKAREEEEIAYEALETARTQRSQENRSNGETIISDATIVNSTISDPTTTTTFEEAIIDSEENAKVQREALFAPVKNELKTITNMRGRAGRVVKATDSVDQERQGKDHRVTQDTKIFNKSDWAKASTLRDEVEARAARTAPLIKAAIQEVMNPGRAERVNSMVKMLEEVRTVKTAFALLRTEFQKIKEISDKTKTQSEDALTVANNAQKSTQQTTDITAKVQAKMLKLQGECTETTQTAKNTKAFVQQALATAQEELQKTSATAEEAKTHAKRAETVASKATFTATTAEDHSEEAKAQAEKATTIAEKAQEKAEQAAKDAQEATIYAAKALQTVGITQKAPQTVGITQSPVAMKISVAMKIIQQVKSVANTLLQALEHAKTEKFESMVQSLQSAQNSQTSLDNEINHEINHEIKEKINEEINYKMKATQAEAEENHEIAHIWNFAAQAPHNKKSTEAAVKCVEHLLKAQEAQSENKTLAQQERELAGQFWILAQQPAQKATEEIFNALLKSQEARAKGDQNLATCWRETAKQYQNYQEYTQMGYSNPSMDLSEKCAVALKKCALYETQASEARVAGNPELVSSWATTAKQFQTIAQLYDQWIKASEACKPSEEIQRLNAKIYAEAATAETLIKSAEYFTKAHETHIANNQELAACYKEVAESLKKEPSQGNRPPIIEALVKQAEYSEKAQKAQAAGRQELANLFKGLAANHHTLSLDSPQIHQQLEEARRNEQNARSSYDSQCNRSTNDQYAYQQRDEAYKRLQKEQQKVNELSQLPNLINTARQYIQSAPPQIERLEKEAGYLEKAQQAQVRGDSEQATAWKKLLEQFQHAQRIIQQAPQQINSYQQQMNQSGQDRSRAQQYITGLNCKLASANRMNNQTLPMLVTWLERTQEAQSVENKNSCKTVVQQLQKALDEDQKVLQSAENTLMDNCPVTQAASVANQLAHNLAQRTEQLWKTYKHQETLQSNWDLAEQSLTHWSEAVQLIKTVLENKSQTTQALKAGKQEEARSSAQKAKEAAKAALVEIEKVQEEMIKSLCEKK